MNVTLDPFIHQNQNQMWSIGTSSLLFELFDWQKTHGNRPNLIQTQSQLKLPQIMSNASFPSASRNTKLPLSILRWTLSTSSRHAWFIIGKYELMILELKQGLIFFRWVFHVAPGVIFRIMRKKIVHAFEIKMNYLSMWPVQHPYHPTQNHTIHLYQGTQDHSAPFPTIPVWWCWCTMLVRARIYPANQPMDWSVRWHSEHLQRNWYPYFEMTHDRRSQSTLTVWICEEICTTNNRKSIEASNFPRMIIEATATPIIIEHR